MKIFSNTVLLITTIVGSAFALEVESQKSVNSITIDDNISSISADVRCKEVKIKDGGIERSIYIPIVDDQATIGTKFAKQDSKLTAKKGLIIDFIDKNMTTDAFESRFNIKLKEKLMIGYFIFENQSDLSDIELIESILKWDENNHVIKTIRPNWRMEVEKY